MMLEGTSINEPSTKPVKPRFHHPQFWLCVILTSGEFALLYCMFFVHIPDANQRIADTMIGSYTTAWLAALGYFYNTNFGSNNKTELLAKAEPVKVP